MRTTKGMFVDQGIARLCILIFLVVFCLGLTAFVAPIAWAEEVALRFEFHPSLSAAECPFLFGVMSGAKQVEELAQEPDYFKLLSQGWVSLQQYDFGKEGEFYPCVQNVVVRFPTKADYYSFVKELDPGPQYPFYSGADYLLRVAIHEYAARSGDPKTYEMLLRKDCSSSASEVDAPVYAILRKNSEAFLRAFSALDEPERHIAVDAQYNINEPVGIQLVPDESISSLPPELKAVAREFNNMMLRQDQR